MKKMKKTKKTKIMAFILTIALIALPAIFLWSCGETEDKATLGSGATSFKLEITGKDGNTETYTVKTDEKTVGEALVKIGFIAEGETYFETLNGVTASYDADKSYWSFYIDGEYASVGAFDAEVKADGVYKFEYTVDTGEAMG